MMKETELAEKVVAWLTVQHWDVYQEVQPRAFGRTADIVAVCGQLIWVVECKTSLSLALLEQAVRWNGKDSMCMSAEELYSGGSWGGNDFVEYPYKKQVKKIAERLKKNE